jgi:hypothetical protein
MRYPDQVKLSADTPNESLPYRFPNGLGKISIFAIHKHQTYRIS